MDNHAAGQDRSIGRTLRQFLANLGLVFAGLAVGLLIAEGALRIYNPFGFRLKGDRIVLPVNESYQIMPDGLWGVEPVVRHSRNVLGFRGAEPPDDFDGALSIVFVGGSTTESFLQTEGRSWPEKVDSLLAPLFNGLWVNNAGLDGHSTFGHLILVNDLLAGLKPDAVVILSGINDVGLDRFQSDANSLLISIFALTM